MNNNLNLPPWLVIVGVAVLPFVLIKKVLFAKTDKIFKEVAQKLKLNFKSGFIGAAKVVGNYQGFDIKIRAGGRVAGAQTNYCQASAKG